MLAPRRIRVVAIALLVLGSIVSMAVAEDLQEFDSFKGVWVRSGAIECFAGLQPKFRILAIRRPRQETLLAGSKVSEAGVRLAFMGPDQIPASFDVGDQLAEVLERNDKFTRVRLKPADNLRYTVTITPDPNAAKVVLDLDLQNQNSTPRRLACWSVLSFPRQAGGLILVPFGQSNRDRRKLVIPWWTRMPQESFSFERKTLSVELGAPVNNNVCKVGINTNCGWIAYMFGEQAIVSSAPFEAAPVYPEDNANVSFFVASSPQTNRAEIEHMGPLETVPPGSSTQFTQTITLLTLPADAPTADVRRDQIDAQLNPPPASQPSQ